MNQDSNDSEAELPTIERRVISKISDTEYLKLFQMKNPMHDIDREKSKSIISNRVMPEIAILNRNPYLNHKPQSEHHINLHAADLLRLQ